jgi:integrase
VSSPETSGAIPGGEGMPAQKRGIPYRGKRGTAWYVTYLDSAGKQVKERLGPAKSNKRPDGLTKKKAEKAVRARLVAVDGHPRQPARVDFATFAREWLVSHADKRDLRRTTRADYSGNVENHLIPFFGERAIAEIQTSDIDDYVVWKLRGDPPLAPRTVNQHMTRLHTIFEAARRYPNLGVRENPVSLAERPMAPRSRWTILTPSEIAAVMDAFDYLIMEAKTPEERAWCQTAKVMTCTMQYAWLRRGELLGLKWCAVDLNNADGPRLHVRETLVRGHPSDPKTESGERTITLGTRLAEELSLHWSSSAYRAEHDFVFCHPSRGTPVPSGYFAKIMTVVLARAEITRKMREYHDWRHTGITNGAAAGMEPMQIMRMAGHADFKTTQNYIDLAGTIFSTEVEKLSNWYEATPGTGTKLQRKA